MREFIDGHEAVTPEDHAELALALWLGEDDETPGERAARLDAARGIFVEDPELAACAARAAALFLDGRAALLGCLLPVRARHGSVREAAA